MATVRELLEKARTRNESFAKSNMHIRMKLAADMLGVQLGLDLKRSSLTIANLVELGYYFDSNQGLWVKQPNPQTNSSHSQSR